MGTRQRRKKTVRYCVPWRMDGRDYFPRAPSSQSSGSSTFSANRTGHVKGEGGQGKGKEGKGSGDKGIRVEKGPSKEGYYALVVVEQMGANGEGKELVQGFEISQKAVIFNFFSLKRKGRQKGGGDEGLLRCHLITFTLLSFIYLHIGPLTDLTLYYYYHQEVSFQVIN